MMDNQTKKRLTRLYLKLRKQYRIDTRDGEVVYVNGFEDYKDTIFLRYIKFDEFVKLFAEGKISRY